MGGSPLRPGREHSCDGGALLPPPWGALGLWPSPQGTLNPTPIWPPSSCPHTRALTLHQRAWAALHSRGPTPLCTCVPRALNSPQVCVATLHSHACAQASRVCPAHCQPSSESGRASLPLAHFVAAVDGWVCFSLCVLGSGKKIYISLNELPLGQFSLHFSAQVSIKGTSLSVSNSFALNSSGSFARAV